MNTPPANRIEVRDGCTLIFGQVPITALSEILLKQPQNSVLSPDLARMAKASLAFGNKRAVASLMEALKPQVRARAAEKNGRFLSESAIEWLALGKQVPSSIAIFVQLLMPHFPGATTSISHPHDPFDLRSCRLLLEQVPSTQKDFVNMRTVSPQWAALVDAWPGLCICMDEENPQWRTVDGGRSPNTYKMMQDIFAAVQSKHQRSVSAKKSPRQPR